MKVVEPVTSANCPVTCAAVRMTKLSVTENPSVTTDTVPPLRVTVPLESMRSILPSLSMSTS